MSLLTCYTNLPYFTFIPISRYCGVRTIIHKFGSKTTQSYLQRSVWNFLPFFAILAYVHWHLYSDRRHFGFICSFCLILHTIHTDNSKKAPLQWQLKVARNSSSVIRKFLVNQLPACRRLPISFCCTRKRDVCVTPSLIVFQRPAGRVFYFA